MHFLLINHIQNARQSLKRNRIRSTLTMLGVVIGIASITAILSLSSGASKVVSNQVDSIGNNIAVIRPGTSTNTIKNILQPQANLKYIASTLTEKDIKSISETPHVQAIAPLMILNGLIKADSVAPSDSTIIATTPDFAEISKIVINDGQFLDDSVNINTVVIGRQLSINIFGTESSIGRTLTIHEHVFTVIGVLARINEPINYNLVDLDNSAIIDFSVGKEINQNIAQIQQINIKIDSITNLDNAVSQVKKTIFVNHNKEIDFSVLNGSQISQPTNQLFYVITGITAIVTIISLIVGGISIMNIMLMTVSERTREIGIRKALGANNNDILWQFLIESLIISISGGIFGYIVGYITAFGLSTFLTFSPIFSWQIAAMAIAISLGVGILFGIYPALKASRKDPIESLHQYN